MEDRTVSVRDSWDILDTPRTANSEDELESQTAEVSHNVEHASHRSNRLLGSPNRKHPCSMTKPDSTHRPSTARKSILVRPCERVRPLRPASADVYKSDVEVTKVIPRRYRKMRLKTHDDMLQEQYEQLRHLLHDSENLSREELRLEHISQTRNIIANYRSMSGGARARGILISRSMPESLRPKSPRSAPSSCFTSPREGSRSRSLSTSRSTSPDSRHGSNKRVSFSSPKRTRTRRESASSTGSNNLGDQKTTELSTSASLSDSDEDLPSTSNSPADKDSGSPVLLSDQSVSPPAIELSTAEDDDKMKREETSQPINLRVGSVEQEIAKRATTQSPRSNYAYTQEEERSMRSEPTKRKKKADVISREISPAPSDKLYGVIIDSSGHKHSDSHLRKTSNPHLKEWLKEKEKMIKLAKKKQRETLQNEKAAQELEMKRQEERKLESQKKLKDWQKAKRKEARLLRRQNLAKRKLEVQEPMPLKTAETNVSNHNKKQKEKTGGSGLAPEPHKPSNPRPKSAPAKRRVNHPQEIPLEKLIQQSPGLKEKLNQLDKQKRMRHRQSYDEWLKIKEREKRDTLKVIREQRLKLEKEISEETARVISDAARRRMDNLRYKGSTATQEEKSPKAPRPPKKEPTTAAYTWSRGDQSGAPQPGGDQTRQSKLQPGRSSKMPSQKNAQSANKAKPQVEDKVGTDNSNPFCGPTKPRRSKSRLEEQGINGAEFSRFLWNIVNEQENEGDRPEPQGADSPQTKIEQPASQTNKQQKPDLKTSPPMPTASTTPVPPPAASDKESSEPIIENGRTIFSMTSIE